MRLLRGAPVVLLAALLLIPAVALAQSKADRDAARAHAIAGKKLFEAGKLDDSIDRFQKAEAIIHAPPHLLYIARVLDKQGKVLAARDTYAELVAEPVDATTPRAFKRAVDEGKSELPAVQARVPKLTVRVAGPEARAVTLTIDGAAAEVGQAQELETGEHAVAADADGWTGASQRVSLKVSDAKEVTLTLGAAIMAPPHADEPDESASSELPILPIAIAGVGVAGLVVGTVTGVIALNKAHELKTICEGLDPCPSENEKLKKSAEKYATVSTVTLVVGGVLVAGGTTWLLIELLGGSEANEADAWMRPQLGPGYLGVEGSF